MIVVSDTSPLNYLVLIGHVDVLPTLFDRIVTPPAVIAELLHPSTPQIVHAWAMTPPSWLEIIPPSLIDSSLNLGRGEAEAISVALELEQFLKICSLFFLGKPLRNPESSATCQSDSL